MSKHCCGNCAWAQFEMTSGKRPHVKSNTIGRCIWPMPPVPDLAQCIFVSNKGRTYIWPTDGTHCKVWAGKSLLKIGGLMRAHLARGRA